MRSDQQLKWNPQRGIELVRAQHTIVVCRLLLLLLLSVLQCLLLVYLLLLRHRRRLSLVLSQK
jgi:hypothetical protein